jgi:hypothetical protein
MKKSGQRCLGIVWITSPFIFAGKHEILFQTLIELFSPVNFSRCLTQVETFIVLARLDPRLLTHYRRAFFEAAKPRNFHDAFMFQGNTYKELYFSSPSILVRLMPSTHFSQFNPISPSRQPLYSILSINSVNLFHYKLALPSLFNPFLSVHISARILIFRSK